MTCIYGSLREIICSLCILTICKSSYFPFLGLDLGFDCFSSFLLLLSAFMEIHSGFLS